MKSKRNLKPNKNTSKFRKKKGGMDPDSPASSPLRKASIDSTEASEMGMEKIHVDGEKHYYNPGEDDVYDKHGNLVGTEESLKKEGKEITRSNSIDSDMADEMGMEKIFVDGKEHYYNPGEDDVYDKQGNLLGTEESLKKEGKKITRGGNSKKKTKKSNCKKQKTKKYLKRKSPHFPANQCKNKRKMGNDKSYYDSVKDKNGVHRWVKVKKTVKK